VSVSNVDVKTRRALMFTPMETRREVLVEAAILADRLGYEAFVVPEGWGLDAGIILAEIAVRTDRIRLVAGIYSVWGRTAATLAMTAASLDQVADGRFSLGLGASTAGLTESFHGVDFVEPAARLEQTVVDVRQLLNGGRANIDGDGPGLRLGVTPTQPIPIWVAGLGERAVATAIEHADVWFPVMVPRDRLVERRADAASNNSCEIVSGPFGAVDQSSHTGREAVCQTIAWYLTGMGSFYGDYVSDSGYASAVTALRAANSRPRPGQLVWPHEADALLEQLGVFGDSQSVGAQLERWDTLVDVVSVGVGPGSRDSILSLVEAAAPPRVSAGS
jgi:alkanesulfonate monooxygenase SsuD/methylene tetrahydromethanopterin reductase-like flavin-dependent oxidoreductase (luciferase family)